MKGQTGLRALERIGEVTHTLFSVFQALHDLESRFIRQRMKKDRALIAPFGGNHSSSYHINNC